MSFSERLPPAFRKTFIRHVNMLRFIGLDILDERNEPITKNYCKFCIFNVLFIWMLVGQVSYIVAGSRTNATIVDVANAVPTTFMVLQDAVKMIVIFCKRKEIKSVIVGIAALWPPHTLSDRKEQTLKKWLRQFRTLDYVYFSCAIVALCMYEAVPFIRTVHAIYGDPEDFQYLYPLQLYFLHCVNAHWQYAIAYLVLVLTSVPTHLVLYISTDLVLMSLTFNLSALMDLLQMDLEDAVRTYDLDDGTGTEDVKSTMSRHQKLLRLADKLNNIFALLVFVQISFSSVVICCFGFLSMTAQGMLLDNLFAAFGVSVAVWNLCWTGQLLADTSFGVSEAAYRSEWYNKDAKIRRCIMIVMTRAQKPCYLTALGFSNLTLANFSKILSTSWSYLSLLKQMYQDSEA